MAFQQVRAVFCAAAFFAAAGTWPAAVQAQGRDVPNFHPCNAQPALPICEHGYGRRLAVMRWGALPESSLSGPLDPDAAANASLITQNPAKEVERLKSSSVFVQDMSTSDVLFARNANVVRPIASISKLMTALVIVDDQLPMDEMIRIEESDVDTPSDLPSRLAVGSRLSRSDLLHLALMSSENSAAHALGRTYPGGMATFVQAMNAKAHELGMTDSKFVEPIGLSNENVSSPRDLAKLVYAASQRTLIQRFSTDTHYSIAAGAFRNTNLLVGRPNWTILASKTGTTRMAGDCLVMMTSVGNRNLAMVLLNAGGTSGSRFGDAVRVRRILGSETAMR